MNLFLLTVLSVLLCSTFSLPSHQEDDFKGIGRNHDQLLIQKDLSTKRRTLINPSEKTSTGTLRNPANDGYTSRTHTETLSRSGGELRNNTVQPESLIKGVMRVKATASFLKSSNLYYERQNKANQVSNMGFNQISMNSNRQFKNRFCDPQPPGLNFDRCESDDDCQDARECVFKSDDGDRIGCNSDATSCFCFWREGLECDSRNDCHPGEICEQFQGNDNPICASQCEICEFVTDQLNSSPLPISPGSGTGLNGDSCETDNDCFDTRVCRKFSDSSSVRCPLGGSDCICLPTEAFECSGSDDCTRGEVCTKFSDSDPICVSYLDTCDLRPIAESPSPAPSSSPTSVDSMKPTETPTTSATPSATPSATTLAPPSATPSRFPTPPIPSESRSDVCIDVTALSTLDNSDLVFEDHKMAIVNCDSYGSCATAGHMVVWNGKGMMMKTYCAEIGGCERKQLLVNSPKWKRSLRLDSKTKGLVYTAFAARYESVVEEVVLKTAVHIGL